MEEWTAWTIPVTRTSRCWSGGWAGVVEAARTGGEDWAQEISISIGNAVATKERLRNIVVLAG